MCGKRILCARYARAQGVQYSSVYYSTVQHSALECSTGQDRTGQSSLVSQLVDLTAVVGQLVISLLQRNGAVGHLCYDTIHSLCLPVRSHLCYV